MEDNKELASALGYQLVEDTETKKETKVTEETTKAKETPASEKKEESVEQSDIITDSSEVTQKDKTETLNFEDLLLEKSGGKFKSYDELEKALSEQPTDTNSVEFANEQLETLNRYVKDGGKMEDFLKTQIDYSDMSEMDIIKAEMKLNDSDLTDSDIKFLLDREYQLDTEEYDEDEVRLSKIKLRKDAKQARTTLKKWQDKYVISEKKESVEVKKEVETSEQPDHEALEKERVRWEKVVNESASKLNKIDFEINEKGDKFTFSLSDEDRANVIKANSNLSKFWGRFMNEDGTENIDKLNKTMFVVDNFDKIIRAASSQSKSDGKDEVLKDIKNPDYSANSGNVESGNKSLQQQMYDAWQKQN